MRITSIGCGSCRTTELMASIIFDHRRIVQAQITTEMLWVAAC